jgi:hypothetical protein
MSPDFFADGHRKSVSRRSFLACGLLLAPSLRAAPRNTAPEARFLRFEQIEPLLKNCGLPLPKDLSGLGEEAFRREWPSWTRNRDRDIRSRLLRGEEDSLVNFVLFGVSFTDQPRIVPDDTASVESATRLFQTRVQNFIQGIAAPGTNERLLWLKDLMIRRGFSTASPDERQRLGRYVLENISRYFKEQDQFRANLNETRRTSDATAAFSARSELYQDRGLSVDTDFRPNYAIEQALLALKRQGRLSAVRRAAIIGPGLDFADKNYGFDYYPLQTLQPFALIDSLVRVKLARASDLHLTVFDISAQTLDHLARAIRLARSKQPYTVQLVLDRTRSWNGDVLSYWHEFGDQLGVPVDPVPPPPGVRNVDSRAVRVRPEIVGAMEPRTLNPVLQHLDLPADQRYDLVVATNVFIYYSAFEHVLSLLDIESMLAPHGLFLSNDLLQACPGMTLRSTGNVSVAYSDRASDSDRIEIYARQVP